MAVLSTEAILLLAKIRQTLKSGTIEDLPDVDAMDIPVHEWRLSREDDIAALDALARDADKREAFNRRIRRDGDHENRALTSKVARWNAEHDANVLLRRSRR